MIRQSDNRVDRIMQQSIHGLAVHLDFGELLDLLQRDPAAVGDPRIHLASRDKTPIALDALGVPKDGLPSSSGRLACDWNCVARIKPPFHRLAFRPVDVAMAWIMVRAAESSARTVLEVPPEFDQSELCIGGVGFDQAA